MLKLLCCLSLLCFCGGAVLAQRSLQDRLVSELDSSRRSALLDGALREFRNGPRGVAGFVHEADMLLMRGTDPVLRYWRAVALGELKLLRRAIADVDFLLHADPNAAVLLALRGDLLLWAFDRPGALEAYAAAGESRHTAAVSTLDMEHRLRHTGTAQVWIFNCAAAACAALALCLRRWSSRSTAL